MRRLDKAIAVEYIRNYESRMDTRPIIKITKCMHRQKKRREDNLPIKQGVMNSNDRFYRAFVASFPKAEHTTSFFDQSAQKLLW
jgi:hypothetical protein